MPSDPVWLLLVAVTPFLFVWLINRHAARKVAELRCDPDYHPLKRGRINWTFHKPLIKAAERLEKEDPTPPDDPPLTIGDACRLVGDLGPVMLVVDENDTQVLTSWDDGDQEYKFSREIVRRWRPDQPAKERKEPQPVMVS